MPSPPPNRVSADSLQCPPGFLGVVPDHIATDENDNGNIVDTMEYLTNRLSPKVYDVAIESQLELATKLSERLGVRVWMKREDLQPISVFSFKLRGAYNMMAKLPREQLDLDRGWKSVERLGATVVLIGDSYDEAQTYAKKRAQEEGRSFIPPFDHPDIIIGQGTVGMEIMRQTKSSFIF
ncbi:unnamed protein product, partial [Prunus brigantina]